ncbi:MAG: hypothetical protein ACLTSZ_05930 [Lachnospiraceae bacterium]
MDSARSEYRSVTDVSIPVQERYAGEAEMRTKYLTTIYFNDDPEWKVLATYDVAAGCLFVHRRKARGTDYGRRILPQGTKHRATQAGGAASAPSSHLPSGGSSQPVQCR